MEKRKIRGTHINWELLELYDSPKEVEKLKRQLRGDKEN